MVTLIFYRPISNFVINNTKIDDNISSIVYEKIKDEDTEKSDNEIIKFAQKYILDDIKESTNSFIAKRIGETIVEVGTFIALIIVLRVALFIVSVIFTFIADLPIIKQFDKIGGTTYGMLQGLLINLVIFALILIILPLTNINQKKVENNINSSRIGSFLYNENIILKIIK